MPSKRSASVGTISLIVCLAAHAQAVDAQGLELTPFVGYRFGGDLFELATGHQTDVDGSPALGLVVNVPLSNGMHVEALVAQQRARVPVAAARFGPESLRRVTVGYAQVGGLQELSDGQIRPFLTGVLGLTRYASDGNGEVRFTVGAGGGVKLFPARHLGLRLDGRVYTTFVDADTRFVACAAGTCVASLRLDVVWQAEFSAGIVLRLQ